MNRRLLSRADLRAKGVTASNATLLANERQGLFPRRVYPTPHRCGWFEDEIDAHLVASRATPERIQRATPKIPRLAHLFAAEVAA